MYLTEQIAASKQRVLELEKELEAAKRDARIYQLTIRSQEETIFFRAEKHGWLADKNFIQAVMAIQTQMHEAIVALEKKEAELNQEMSDERSKQRQLHKERRALIDKYVEEHPDLVFGKYVETHPELVLGRGGYDDFF